MTTKPRVLNFKVDGIPDGAVYIGRAMSRYGLKRSDFANPYTIGKDGTRAEVLAKFRRDLAGTNVPNEPSLADENGTNVPPLDANAEPAP